MEEESQDKKTQLKPPYCYNDKLVLMGEWVCWPMKPNNGGPSTTFHLSSCVCTKPDWSDKLLKKTEDFQTIATWKIQNMHKSYGHDVTKHFYIFLVGYLFHFLSVTVHLKIAVF